MLELAEAEEAKSGVEGEGEEGEDEGRRRAALLFVLVLVGGTMLRRPRLLAVRGRWRCRVEVRGVMLVVGRRKAVLEEAEVDVQ